MQCIHIRTHVSCSAQVSVRILTLCSHLIVSHIERLVTPLFCSRAMIKSAISPVSGSIAQKLPSMARVLTDVFVEISPKYPLLPWCERGQSGWM
jgi:hypothetical protein